MTRLIMSVLIANILALTAPAFANAGYGNALREAADAGQITPHGVGDSKAWDRK